MASSIHISNAAPLAPQDLERIAETVGRIFGVVVTTDQATLSVDRAFDSGRRQYNSTALLAQMLAEGAPGGQKRIAIVDVDLFIPVLTFVFGEAQLDGTVSIVSMHRLANQFYGIEADSVLLHRRLEKEVVHELGHTFGLYHCRQFECVMRSSTYVEEIDLKRVEPCEQCGAILARKRETVQP